LGALRRLPHTLIALEAAARKVSTEAPREERKWYQMPAFWIGLIGGALIMFVFGPRNVEREIVQPTPEPARIEQPVTPPVATAPIPPAVEEAQETTDAATEGTTATPEVQP
jgi:hypothetical protein